MKTNWGHVQDTRSWYNLINGWACQRQCLLIIKQLIRPDIESLAQTDRQRPSRKDFIQHMSFGLEIITYRHLSSLDLESSTCLNKWLIYYLTQQSQISWSLQSNKFHISHSSPSPFIATSNPICIVLVCYKNVTINVCIVAESYT